jgi:hypothetical protein
VTQPSDRLAILFWPNLVCSDCHAASEPASTQSLHAMRLAILEQHGVQAATLAHSRYWPPAAGGAGRGGIASAAKATTDSIAAGANTKAAGAASDRVNARAAKEQGRQSAGEGYAEPAALLAEVEQALRNNGVIVRPHDEQRHILGAVAGEAAGALTKASGRVFVCVDDVLLTCGWGCGAAAQSPMCASKAF